MPGDTSFDRAFLAQSIERLRAKLIDLSKKNPLISFKHNERGASFVRVVDEDPDALYRQLRAGTMTFEPLPDPEEEPADERTSEFKIALERAKRTESQHDGQTAERWRPKWRKDGLILTEPQLAAREKAKADKEAHGEFDSACPGYCGAQDTFYVGTLKGWVASISTHRHLRQGRLCQALRGQDGDQGG